VEFNLLLFLRVLFKNKDERLSQHFEEGEALLFF
jgi:hypothetical protein